MKRIDLGLFRVSCELSRWTAEGRNLAKKIRPLNVTCIEDGARALERSFMMFTIRTLGYHLDNISDT